MRSSVICAPRSRGRALGHSHRRAAGVFRVYGPQALTSAATRRPPLSVRIAAITCRVMSVSPNYPRKRALERIAREKVLYERSPAAISRSASCIPNTYRLGMANLGFQAIFHIFESDPPVAADRAFLPDADERAAFRAVPSAWFPSSAAARSLTSKSWHFRFPSRPTISTC